jgi:hypothetical protein
VLTSRSLQYMAVGLKVETTKYYSERSSLCLQRHAKPTYCQQLHHLDLTSFGIIAQLHRIVQNSPGLLEGPRSVDCDCGSILQARLGSRFRSLKMNLRAAAA